MYRNQNGYSAMCRADADQRAGRKIAFGVILIVIGGSFFLAQAGYIESRTVGHLWPLIFSVFGLNRLLFSRSDYSRIKGALQIFLGFWIFACLDHLWGWTFSMTWPMILIATGLCYIFSYLFRDRSGIDDQQKPQHDESQS